MRALLATLLVMIAVDSAALADPGRPQTFYVRYAINMDFLPPLLGERRCVRFKPCQIVKLGHFALTLTTLPNDTYGDRGRLEIECRFRECALRDGQDSIEFRKPDRLAHFDVGNDEYARQIKIDPVIRYRGDPIGEIFLAYPDMTRRATSHAPDARAKTKPV